MIKLIFISISLFILNFLAFGTDLKSNLYHQKLKNGLEVLVYEKKAVPIAAVQMWYDVGSFHEINGIRGMAHFFEHMMFRGSKNIGDEEHSQLIENVGGRSNAYTADDMTVYVQTLPSKHVDLAIKLEAERMEHLIIDEKRLEKEKEVVKEEYRWRYQNNPYGDIQKKTREILFPPTHYGIGPIGTLEDVGAFTILQSQSFYETYYSPNNATLIIVGDVNHKNIFNTVSKYFSHLEEKEIVLSTPFKSKTQFKKNYKKMSQLPMPATLFAYYIPESKHEDLYALTILFKALSAGNGSRLHRHLVRDKEIADYAYGFNFSLKETGVYAFPVIHKKGNENHIQKEIDKLLFNIHKKGLTEYELQKLKNQIIASKTFSQYSVEELARQIGYSLIYKNDPLSFTKDVHLYNKINNEDIKYVARKYFNKRNRVIINFEPKERFKRKNLARKIKLLISKLKKENT